MVRRKVKLLTNVFQYLELLKKKWMHVRKGELLSSKRVIAQGKSPHGLKFNEIQLHHIYSNSSPLTFININITIKESLAAQSSIFVHIQPVNLLKGQRFSEKEVRRLKEEVKKGMPHIL